jgi:hypothetical protein
MSERSLFSASAFFAIVIFYLQKKIFFGSLFFIIHFTSTFFCVLLKIRRTFFLLLLLLLGSQYHQNNNNAYNFTNTSKLWPNKFHSFIIPWIYRCVRSCSSYIHFYKRIVEWSNYYLFCIWCRPKMNEFLDYCRWRRRRQRWWCNKAWAQFHADTLNFW